ncbi:MAG: ribosome biogenesis GTPase Der, partial [Burkholderiales bacterium]
LVVDTGGFEPAAKDGILHQMAKQTLQAVAESDRILFVVDAREGLTAADKAIAANLRKTGRPLFLVVNKTEGMAHAAATSEFHELGLGDPLPIAAAHGEGVHELVDLVLADVPQATDSEEQSTHPKIAVVGRPNVGKSTLVNALLGEERVIVFDQPGTTRDSIYVNFQRQGKPYTLIDTAGLRRRGRVVETVEKFSMIKTLQAVADANVAVLVFDAQDQITEQDAHIAGIILEAGRALVVVLNKWDGLSQAAREQLKRDLAWKLKFLDFARIHPVSALEGLGLGTLMKAVDEAYAATMAKLSTPKLTRILIAAVEKQQPPRSGLTRPKLRYAHQGGSNPPRIVIHGNALDAVPETYRRYLEGVFRTAFKLQGTPLKVEFKRGRNPYAGKKD